MRSGCIAGCVAMTLVAAAATGCTSGSAKQRPGPTTMVDVTKAIGATSLLHWTGSWRAYGQPMTLDLRAVGNGDAVGTVADHGDRAQVLVVDGEVLVKGGKAYWRHGGTSAADVAHYAGRWVDGGSSVEGADLGGLSPRKLSDVINHDNQTGATNSPAVLPWTPAPATATAAATPRPTPSGVPGGAVRFVVDKSISSLSEGTYWASASSPHVLLAYSGAGMPGDGDTSVKQSILSVRSGGGEEARAAYAEMAAEARTVPAKVTAQRVGLFQVNKVDLPKHCRTGNCLIKVTWQNPPKPPQWVRATVRITLYGSKSITGSDGRNVGSCEARLPTAAPGKTVHGSCEITDRRVDAFWNSIPGSVLKFAFWNERHSVVDTQIQEPYDPVALAAKLTSRENTPSAAHTP